LARSRNGGFTLAELLVVAAITTILSSVMFPVLRQGRMAAERTKCGSGLRQIGMALMMYLDDNGGRFPLERAGARPPQATYYSLDKPSNPYNNQNSYSIAGLAVAIYPYCRSVDIFMCPSGPQDNSVPRYIDMVVSVKCPGMPLIKTNLVSFPLNQHSVRYSEHPDRCSPQCAQGRTPDDYYRRGGKVFSEGGPWAAWPDSWNGRLIQDPYYVWEPKLWCHNGGTNILYYDGSARWVPSSRAVDALN